MKRTAALLIVLNCVAAYPVWAAVPDFVTYSGRLTDGTAWGQSQTVDLTFWLCESPQGDVGDCVWSEPHEAVPVEDGYFSVRLGEVVPLPKPLPEGLWIAVAVEGGAPLGPWEHVGAVPFALKAAEVASTGGESVLKAMKLALDYSDAPGDDNYLSDAAFSAHQRGECPVRYERDVSGDNAKYVVCKKGLDEMVKVGDFWIDRYEMKLYTGADCTGTSYTGDDAHEHGFFRNVDDDPPNGKAPREFVPMYACSVKGVQPGRVFTWFQAQRACSLSGKHLCTDAEWLAGAYGTSDPHTEDPGDDSEPCNIWENSKPQGSKWAVVNETIMTGSASECVSDCGAHDMVGNLWEWTADWWGQGPNGADGNQPATGDFHGDGYYNVDDAEYAGSYAQGAPVFPASSARGSFWYGASSAGVFAQSLTFGPSGSSVHLGARCCRR